MMRKLQWLVLNGLFLGLTYLGLFRHSEASLNIVKFSIWVMTLCAIGIVAVRNHADMKDVLIKTSKTAFGDSVENAVDLTIIIAFAATAHFVYATLWTIATFCQLSYREHGKKLATEAA